MSRIGSTPSLQIHRLLPFIVRIDPPLPSPTLANSYPAARFSSQPVAYLASTAGQVDKARIPIGPESAELLPPLKRYRDSFSILRALAGCVRPVPGTIDFDAIDDPYLLPGFMHRICMRSKAAGNVAARALIREGLASNFARLCTELPRIDSLLPLKSPSDLLTQVADGQLSASEAMDRLILLLAPTEAWKLYSEVAKTEKWRDDQLHSLLNLLCATNSGQSGGPDFFCGMPLPNLGELPDPCEAYYAGPTTWLKGVPAITAQSKTPRLSLARSPTAAVVDAEDAKDAENSAVNSSSEEQNLARMAMEGGVPRLTVWSNSCSAECLFRDHSVTLGSNRALGQRALLRGAARFGNPLRAFELAQILWKLEDGQLRENAQASGKAGPQTSDVERAVFLDIDDYNALLLCLHGVPPPQLNEISALLSRDRLSHKTEPGCTSHTPLTACLLAVLLRMSTTGILPDKSSFEAALHSLACDTITSLLTGSFRSHTAFGLGLLEEARLLGLPTSLGMMNNLLALITAPARWDISSVVAVSSRPSQSVLYSTSPLINAFINELEIAWADRPPCRTDTYSYDDLRFFTQAMRCLRDEADLTTARRLHNLLTGQSDRRFLFLTNSAEESYIADYAHLLLGEIGFSLTPARVKTNDQSSNQGIKNESHIEAGAKAIEEQLDEAWQFYRTYHGTIFRQHNLLRNVFINRFHRAAREPISKASRSTAREASKQDDSNIKSIDEADSMPLSSSRVTATRRLAFKRLVQLFRDLLAATSGHVSETNLILVCIDRITDLISAQDQAWHLLMQPVTATESMAMTEASLPIEAHKASQEMLDLLDYANAQMLRSAASKNTARSRSESFGTLFASLKSSHISGLARLALPLALGNRIQQLLKPSKAATTAEVKAASWQDMHIDEANKTLMRWLRLAEEHNMLQWSWTAEAIYSIWACKRGVDDEIWQLLSLLEGSKLEPTSKIANEQAFIRKLLEPLLEAAEANLAFEAAEIQASSRSLRSNSVVGSSVSSASSVLSTGLLERQGSDAQALIRSAKLGLIAQREKLVASIRSEILTGWISRDHAKQHSAKQTQSLKPQRSRHEAFENQKSSGRRSHRQNIPREVSKSPAMKQAHNRS